MDLNAESDKYHQWDELKNNDVTATDNVQNMLIVQWFITIHCIFMVVKMQVIPH